MVLKRKWIAVALMSAAVSTGATAATASLSGEGFTVSWDDSVPSLFGTPTLLGSNLVFSPLDFGVLSTSNGWTALTASFNLTISAWSGYLLNSVGFVNAGTYALLGSPAKAAVGASLFVMPLDSAGMSSVSGSASRDSSDFGYGVWTLGNVRDAELTGLSTQSANVGLATFLAANAGDADSFTSVGVSAAKLSFGLTQVPPVPEPEAYLMLLSGLGMVGMVARRRSALR